MIENLRVELVPFKSKAYEETLHLRQEILRTPLGLMLSEEECSKEIKDLHVAGFIEEKLIACLVLSPYNEKTIKMRQVAVSFGLQGQGVGKKMVVEAEKLCKERNFDKIILNARDVVVPFYQQLGYTNVSEIFIEVGIPHVKMEKKL